MKQPKFRLRQVVQLMDHNHEHRIDATKPDRIPIGRFGRITRIVPEQWTFRPDDPIQYSYVVSHSYGHSVLIHESWLLPLSGEDITGRI